MDDKKFDTKDCKTCAHYQKLIWNEAPHPGNTICGYIFDTGKSRPCKIGECKANGVWEKRTKRLGRSERVPELKKAEDELFEPKESN